MTSWHVGQIVQVQPRTWSGINRPGGHGRITALHYSSNSPTVVHALDVKYTIGGSDRRVNPDLVQPHQELERGGRQRRRPEPVVEQICSHLPAKGAAAKKKNSRSAGKENTKQPKTQVEAVSRPKPRRKPKIKKKETVTPEAVEAKVYPKEVLLAPMMPTDFSPLSTDEATGRVDPRNPARKRPPATLQPSMMASPGSAFEAPKEKHQKVPKSKGDSPKKRCPQEELPVKSLVGQGHATSHEVYERERAKARQFLDQLVGKSPAVKPPAARTTPPVDTRMQTFLTHFHDLLLNNEGMLEEAGLLAQINQSCSESSFDQADCDRYLAELSTQNRIMRTDGVILDI